MPEADQAVSVITLREIVELTSRVERLLDVSEKHETALYGNGKRGLVRDMDAIKLQATFIRWFMVLTISPIVLGVLGIVGGILTGKIEIQVH